MKTREHSFYRAINLLDTFLGNNGVLTSEEIVAVGIKRSQDSDMKSVSLDVYGPASDEEEPADSTQLRETHTLALGQTGIVYLTTEHHLFGSTDRVFIPSPETQSGPDEADFAITHSPFTALLRQLRPDYDERVA